MMRSTEITLSTVVAVFAGDFVCVEPFKSVDVYLEKNAVEMMRKCQKGIAVIVFGLGTAAKVVCEAVRFKRSSEEESKV